MTSIRGLEPLRSTATTSKRAGTSRIFFWFKYIERDPRKLALLPFVDCRRRSSEIFRRPCFHLHKDQTSLFSRDDVHFPQETAVISFEDPVLHGLKWVDGQFFTHFAEGETILGHRKERIDSPKRLAMEGATAVFLNGLKVLLGPVTFVAGKVIFRVFLVVGNHDAVAGDLGYDRGGGDRKAFLIALYNRLLGKRKIQREEPVDQEKIGKQGRAATAFSMAFKEARWMFS